jgi:hypothetical protein
MLVRRFVIYRLKLHAGWFEMRHCVGVLIAVGDVNGGIVSGCHVSKKMTEAAATEVHGPNGFCE